MLIEASIGDTYGAAFEYAPPEFVIDCNDGGGYYANPKHPKRGKKYTDDTQMGIAVAEMMLHDMPWTSETIAHFFVKAFKRDERTGYASRFYGLLKSVSSGRELIERIVPNSDKSGGAMRAFPVGLYPSLQRVKNVAAIQAAVTHNTQSGMAAAQAAAVIVHYFAYRLGAKENLRSFVKSQVDKIEGVPGWDEPYETKVGEKGWMSVQAAMTAITKSETLTEVLRNSIAFHGDVDTVATIAMAAASFSTEIRDDLDPILYRELEEGPYGQSYLAILDQQLFAKFGGYMSDVVERRVERSYALGIARG